ALAVSSEAPWLQRSGQVLALLGAALALQSLLPVDFDAWVALSTGWLALTEGGMSAAACIMYGATALALVFVPLRQKSGTQLFATFATIGLLVTATSLVGLLLDSPTLASLGLQHRPTPMSNVMAGVLLLSAVAQRGDAGWLSV